VNDKQILITGGTNGIGLAAAEALAALGANLAIVGRSKTRTRIASARIRAAAGRGATVATFIADLSSQASVRRLAAEVLARYPKLDVLVNNAGVMYGIWQLTKDGIELTWAVNHLAPFLLTKLLLHRLKESAPARIITTASQAHQGAHIPFHDLNAERSYRGFSRYCETKLANVLFTTELARRLDGTGVTANCFHPGFVGAFAMAAASIKPSGLLLLLLPVFARVERDWRAPLWVFLGAAGTGILVFGTLAAWGGLEPFITTMQKMMPRYASLGARTVPEISEDVVVWLAPTAGLTLAAVLNIPAPKPPRVRVMIGLTLFGLIHLLVQRKGWFYHVYPLGIGLACWGAWSLASLPPWRAAVCLLLMATTPVWLAQQQALIRTRMYQVLHSASTMQAALEDRLPRGARVQVLDSDYGAFLAMARAGMRQATPHIQWFSLVFAEDSVRHQFVAALEHNPPAAILLTNSQWPQPHGFDAADDWPKFAALLASRYILDRSENENGIAWRLYLRKDRQGARP
jgi:NAD(P)-dependent dehydrogenase (short-subunit alcohol dehydrogenase family)